MSDLWLERLAWLGPVGLIAVTTVLRMVRKKIQEQKAKASQAVTALAETAAAEAAAPPAEQPAPYKAAPPPLEETPEQVYDRMRRANVGDPDIARAHQEAQFRAVELNQAVVPTIHDPRTLKPGEPKYTIEVVDPKAKRPVVGDPATGAMFGVTVVDKRQLPHEMIDTANGALKGSKPNIITRPEREAEARRQDAMAESCREANRPGGKTGADIARQQKNSATLAERAKKEFDEALVEVRADAERKAREILAKGEERSAAIAAEAKERQVEYDVVLNEFVKMVGDEAVRRAEENHARNRSLGKDPLEALTNKELLDRSGAWNY